MAFVYVEIDIAPDGSITARPNPVGVATGDTLVIHVNSNRSEFTKLQVEFAQGADSPFQQFAGPIQIPAKHCVGTGSKVNWPDGVSNSSVTVTALSSPGGTPMTIPVFKVEPPVKTAGCTIVHNYYCCCCGECQKQ